MFVTLPASLPDVLVIEPKVYEDSRGFLLETFRRDEFTRMGVDREFVQENWSHSFKGVLRGLHFQLRHPQAKLVSVLSGVIFDVVVDLRQGSPFFGKWAGLALSSQNKRQVFIPEGFAHGFCVIEGPADVLYRSSAYYAPEDQHGIAWNDPDIAIPWPIADPIVSDKDKVLPRLRETPPELLPV